MNQIIKRCKFGACTNDQCQKPATWQCALHGRFYDMYFFDEHKIEPFAPHTIHRINQQHSQKFIVRLCGNYALKFHTNLCGRVYEAVADTEATPFDSEQDADERARNHGLRRGTFTIEPANQTQGVKV